MIRMVVWKDSLCFDKACICKLRFTYINMDFVGSAVHLYIILSWREQLHGTELYMANILWEPTYMYNDTKLQAIAGRWPYYYIETGPVVAFI